MTSHCNGNHSKTSLSVRLPLSLTVFCHCLSYPIAEEGGGGGGRAARGGE